MRKIGLNFGSLVAFVVILFNGGVAFAAEKEPVFNSFNAAKACTYFKNVSYVDHNTGRLDSIYLAISQRCQEAQMALKVAPKNTEAHMIARDYLARLSQFHRSLVDINVDRFDRSTKLVGGPRNVIRPVSESGFYLIAQSSGVLSSGEVFSEIYQAAFYPVSGRAMR